MSSSLKLELKPNNQVLVTNLQTNESCEVSLSLIQQASHDSLLGSIGGLAVYGINKAIS